MRELFQGIRAVMASSWAISPRRLVISALLMLLGGVSGPLIAVFLRDSTDAVLRRNLSEAVVAVVAVAAVALLSLTMDHFAHIFYTELGILHQIRTEATLGDLTQGTVGLEPYENRDFADRMELLRKETGRYGEAIHTILGVGVLAVQILLTAVLLAEVEPWLLLLPIFAVPPVFLGRAAEARMITAELGSVETTRRGWHLLHLAVSSTAAKEIRLFGLQHEFRRRQEDLDRQVEAQLQRAERRGLLIRLIGQLIFAVGYVAAVILVVRDAIVGRQSVGEVVLIITLAVQTNAQAANAVTLALALQRDARAMGWIQWIREASVGSDATARAQRPVPATLSSGIELRNVWFRYPGSDRTALRDVTVRLPAGAIVAIVGDNGAGKSTMVKLLSRLYRPTEGQILVDGVDLEDIDPELWRERITAGFQDFARIETIARESVGVGDLPRAEDTDAVRSAVERADAQAVLDRLPDGLDTHLGKAYEDGAELSGGQWQRVALSRAMMRNRPLLLLLDEPTAALDPLTEDRLFERYAASARNVGRHTGGITVLVSHRFSTVRMADLIMVVSDGHIIEFGSHADLMAANGVFAEMFNLQAGSYR